MSWKTHRIVGCTIVLPTISAMAAGWSGTTACLSATTRIPTPAAWATVWRSWRTTLPCSWKNYFFTSDQIRLDSISVEYVSGEFDTYDQISLTAAQEETLVAAMRKDVSTLR